MLDDVVLVSLLFNFEQILLIFLEFSDVFFKKLNADWFQLPQNMLTNDDVD